MEIKDTAGNVTNTIFSCECGLTGGCANCHPLKFTMKHRFYVGGPTKTISTCPLHDCVCSTCGLVLVVPQVGFAQI